MSLRVLHLEDDPLDVELIRETLSEAGIVCDLDVVDSREAFVEAIESSRDYDLVFADYSIPGFDGLEALKLFRNRDRTTPFIIVSGTVGEAAVVDALKSGATDYVLKQHRSTLAPAVQRALKEAEERRERLQAQERLKSLSHAVDNTADVIFITDADGVIQFVNPAFERVTGYSKEEAVGKTPRILSSGRHSEGFYRELWETIFAGRGFEAEFVNRRKNGEIFFLNATVSPILDEEGRAVQFLSIGRDVTHRRKTEAALHRSEERYRSLIDGLESLDAGFLVASSDGRILWVNAAFEELFGVEREDCLGERQPGYMIDLLTERLSEDQFERVADRLETAYRDGLVPEELSVRFGSGEAERWLQLRIHPIESGLHAGGRIEQVRDVTEARRTENQLRQAQKMEAIGRLAGGIAHDFNNHLSVILGYSQLALESLDDDDPIRDELEAIREAGEKSSGLTRQILAFSRRQVLQPKVVQLCDVIQECGRMLGRVIGEDIELCFRHESEWRTVEIDPAQMEQVVFNLAINAREAMPDGGRLVVQTEDRLLSRDFAHSRPGVEAGRYVVLRVEDAGVGMRPEVLENIFEPFFTTKEQGTGLGLSTVHGIVKQSGGHIFVSSVPGEGTTFEILLPHVPESSGGEPESGREAGIPAGSGHILVVEDDPLVRVFLQRALESGGYRVSLAEDGHEALRTIRKMDEAVDLVLTDVVMPGLKGPELVHRLQEEHLHTGPVIYLSGYAQEALDGDSLSDQVVFLQKPISPGVLLRQIHALL